MQEITKDTVSESKARKGGAEWKSWDRWVPVRKWSKERRKEGQLVRKELQANAAPENIMTRPEKESTEDCPSRPHIHAIQLLAADRTCQLQKRPL